MYYWIEIVVSTLKCSYAEMVITSEESLKILLEKIPQCEVNGEKMDCRFATRQNLHLFEDIANKRKFTLMLNKVLCMCECQVSHK